MNRIKENWKSPLALLIAVLLLYFASLRVDARRAAPPAHPPAAAPAPADANPPSNEIPELQQLG